MLVALNSAVFATRAAAFDGVGRELALVSVPLQPLYRDRDRAEQDLGETWQAAIKALRLLADEVPDLARRAVALALTGQADGTWLIDEDGDPVAPALLWLDARAAALVAAWHARGVVEAVHGITGALLTPARQSAQLGWLERHQPEVLEQAATALHCKDWLYFCCTGERATDLAEGLAAFGDPRTGAYEDRVLELLGLEEAARLLPPLVDGTRHHGRLGLAAAAASGLAEGMPVVLAPPDGLAAALGVGAIDSAGRIGCTILDSPGIHLLASRPAVASEPTEVSEVMLADGLVRVVANTAGAMTVDWLSEIAQQLLAEVGLIGVARTELEAALERQADGAEPGALLLDSVVAPGVLPGPGLRLRTEVSTCRAALGDLVRGAYEGLAFAARDGHAALGDAPDEIRIGGALAVRPIARQILAASLCSPVRISRRPDPAAVGAALTAAVSLGQYANVTGALAEWVTPYLDPPEPVDPDLARCYARRFEAAPG